MCTSVSLFSPFFLHCAFRNSSCSHTREVCRCRTVNYQIYKFIDIRLYLWRLAPYISGVFSSELSPKSIFCIVTVGELLIAFVFTQFCDLHLIDYFFLVIFVFYSIHSLANILFSTQFFSDWSNRPRMLLDYTSGTVPEKFTKIVRICLI